MGVIFIKKIKGGRLTSPSYQYHTNNPGFRSSYFLVLGLYIRSVVVYGRLASSFKVLSLKVNSSTLILLAARTCSSMNVFIANKAALEEAFAEYLK